MRAIIFANGLIDPTTSVHSLMRSNDLILAADGGAHHCQAFGILPHAVIGDLDSFDPALQDAWVTAGIKFYRYPSRKNFTDLELALQHAIMQGADEIVVFGALGARWDQTLANLLLPAAEGLQDVRIRLVDGLQEIMLLRHGSLKLSGQPGDTVSLIPLGGDVAGITTQGLEYPLLGGTLYFGATRGISNVMLSHEATVQLQTGLLLCVLIHHIDRSATKHE